MSPTVTTEEVTAVADDGGGQKDALKKRRAEHRNTILQQVARREERWRERMAIVDADKTLDPRLAELYRDRTIWDTNQAAAELGVKPGWITAMFTDARKRSRQRPHPGVFIEADVVLQELFGMPHPGFEAGAVRYWALHADRYTWNHKTGKLIPHNPRHGRPRDPANTAAPRRHRKSRTQGTTKD